MQSVQTNNVADIFNPARSPQLSRKWSKTKNRASRFCVVIFLSFIVCADAVLFESNISLYISPVLIKGFNTFYFLEQIVWLCVVGPFRRIINKHTDESLGDCSFLNTCFHMDTCKYVHYEIDSPPEAEGSLLGPQAGTAELGLHAEDTDSNVGKLFPSQVRKKAWTDSDFKQRKTLGGFVFIYLFNETVSVVILSGSAATFATWTCPSWGSSPWWWPTRRGTFTWSCRTVHWRTTRWESSASPPCRTTASSSSGSQEGKENKTSAFSLLPLQWNLQLCTTTRLLTRALGSPSQNIIYNL